MWNNISESFIINTNKLIERNTRYLLSKFAKQLNITIRV